MSLHTPRIGYWAALVATTFGAGYILALAATLAGTTTGPLATLYQLAPSIVLAWAFLVLMACVLDAAPAERRIWTLLGFAFALMYAVINSIVYFTELTVVIPLQMRNEADALTLLRFEPGTFLFAVNGLAYGFMSMATLFAAPAFAREGLERRVRGALVAHGLIGPFIVGAVVWSPLQYIGVLWILTFPAVGVLLAAYFRRSGAS